MTRTDLTNIALSLIGARRIDDLETSTTVEARSARIHFDLTFRSLLRRHQWSFGTRRHRIPQPDTELEDFESDSNEFAYAFPLPEGFVRLIRLATTDIHNPVRHYNIEGKFILTDSPAFELVYVSSDCLDDLDDLFVEAFTLSLASKLAGDVVADPGLKQSFLQQLEQLQLPAATSVDAKEVKSGENFGPRALASMSALVNARFRSDGRPPYTPGLP